MHAAFQRFSMASPAKMKIYKTNPLFEAEKYSQALAIKQFAINATLSGFL
jgi:hypothetical protein